MWYKDIKKNNIWQKGHNILAKIKINKENIHIQNIRDMDHVNHLENYDDQNFNINNLKGINLISVPFGYKKLISHLMLEFVFNDKQKIVLSIEARRKPNCKFSPIKGLFFGYGLIYIWGTYNDLVGLRKEIRKDKVFTYKLNINHDEMKESFIYFLEKTIELTNKPKYYNSIFSNCSTNLWEVFKIKKGRVAKRNYQVVINGNIHKYLEKFGYIDKTNTGT